MKTASNNGFSVVELLVVILIITLLTGLIFGGSLYMHNKAIEVRCQAEFALLEQAIQSYKNDHGYYPRVYVPAAVPAGLPTDPAVIAAKNDSQYGRGGSALYRALTLRSNDYRKAYINIGARSQRQYDSSGAALGGYPAGARYLSNPNGSMYYYSCPGSNNWGVYDLWVGAPLGRILRNWRTKND